MLVAQDFKDRSHLFSYLNEAYQGKAPALHCYSFLLDSNFQFSEALDLARDHGIDISLARKGQDLYLLQVGVRSSYETGYVMSIDGSWLFLTDGHTAKLNSTIGAFARTTSHALRFAYLPSSLLLRWIEKIQRRYDRVSVIEGTIRTMEQTSRKWKKAPIDFSVPKMEKEARKDDGKWTSVSFRCESDGKEIINCRAYESGHLTLYTGRFNEFYQDVVLTFLAGASDLGAKLGGKQRKESKAGPVLHPLGFRLQKPITLDEMQLVKASIIRTYAAAVTHPGNPMLTMQLSDKEDGSVFDLYAYGDKVEIVPLHKATPAALTDLIALVSDVLPTGKPPLMG